jgi:hypothetical protein
MLREAATATVAHIIRNHPPTQLRTNERANESNEHSHNVRVYTYGLRHTARHYYTAAAEAG